MTELGTPMSLTGGFSAMVPAATPEPLLEQINKMFNQLTSSEDARKFFNNIASDPWVTSVAEMKDFIPKEIQAWGEYVRLAKIEPQG